MLVLSSNPLFKPPMTHVYAAAAEAAKLHTADVLEPSYLASIVLSTADSTTSEWEGDTGAGTVF
jgi:hypothetical protein